MELRTLFLQRVQKQLTRKSLVSPSRYAENVRIMGAPYPGPWSFKYHPWLREMHDCKSEHVVGRKAAQMGYTEWALNTAFYYIDIEGKNVLYVLPNKTPDAGDFSNARFNPALELSEHLKTVFTDVNNVGHKRAGSANIYIRGSRSKSGLRSVPVQVLILDEVDVFDQDNIGLAKERVSGQPTKKILELSTPTIENYGIEASYSKSDQCLFFFSCPSCSRFIDLQFPRNIKITADDPGAPGLINTYYFCHLCEAVLNQNDKPIFLAKGQWVSQRESSIKGYHINQMYSSPIQPHQLAAKYLKGFYNAADEQEFYNSTLGVPHTAEGARVTEKEIAQCIGDYMSYTDHSHTSFVTMGVDVGKWLHIEITDWYWENGAAAQSDPNQNAVAKVLACFKLKTFEELDQLMYQFNVQMCVVDMNPERREARRFVNRFPGRSEMCEYPQGQFGRQVVVFEEEQKIHVDRTAWLDLSLGRFHGRKIYLPQDISFEYKQQIQNQTRVFYRDRDGNVKAKYVNGTNDDHYGHARNYSEIAFGRALSSTTNTQLSHPWQKKR